MINNEFKLILNFSFLADFFCHLRLKRKLSTFFWSLIGNQLIKNFRMEKTSTSVWNNCLAIIKDNIPAQSFKTWFEPVKAVRLEGDVLTIQVPSLFFTNGWRSTMLVSFVRLLKSF
ncbi:hypothetical protein L950_0232020 [Sphingobacterium sp. IITKGP-BTPF85]|nr:hypothetical protein L950_0232020 [Sphingobacterium sp. IITKGP-BTPF85]